MKIIFTLLLMYGACLHAQQIKTVFISCDLYETCEDFESWVFITDEFQETAMILMDPLEAQKCLNEHTALYAITNGYYYEIYLASCGNLHTVVVDLKQARDSAEETVEQLSIDFTIPQSIYTIKRK